MKRWETCPGVEKNLVVQRTGAEVSMKDGRDAWVSTIIRSSFR